jgi:AbrB family looped-hinge helix DNA binding protein
MNKLSKVRVKRKGQVTIPLDLRSALGIEEGVVLEIKAKDGSLIMTPEPSIEPGKVVGEEEYEKIIAELDKGWRNWR